MTNFETLYRLIERQGTLEQVSTFLRQRKLPSSGGSWTDMREKRLKAAVAAKKLSTDDLVELLRQTEEHGAQHIFLYNLVPGRNISGLFASGISSRLLAAGLPDLGHTSIVDIPDKPTVVEVRYDTLNGCKTIIFKIVEKRSSFSQASESSSNGKRVVVYDEVAYRSVSILRISELGTAEIRIQSHTDAISYAGQTKSVFNALKPIVDELDWKAVHLDKLKDNVLDPAKRDAMKLHFGLRHTQHTNADGTRLQAAVGFPGASMYDDEEAVASVDRFTAKKGHTSCDKASVTMRKGNILRRDVPIMIGGDTNEFAITSKVGREEYEFILGKVIENNK